jgi:hypothetical protein
MNYKHKRKEEEKGGEGELEKRMEGLLIISAS